MLTLLYILGGGAVILTWLSLLSLYITKQHLENSEKELSLKFKKLAYERESAIDTQSFLKMVSAKMGRSAGLVPASAVAPKKGMPPELLELMGGSPDHEEVQEIEEDDDLIGIIFNSTYPPDFSEEQSQMSILTKSDLKQVFLREPTDSQLSDLNDCLIKNDILTPSRLAHFLSQTGHESGGLKWLMELADGTAYEGRKDLGNNQPGDGPKYKGAGLLQLTGRYNYQKFSEFIGDPKVMEGCRYVAFTYPFSSAGWYWDSRNLNDLCDKGASVADITRIVNGGSRGLEDRIAYYERAREMLSEKKEFKPSSSVKKIVATEDTWLKRSPVQSSDLSSDQKVEKLRNSVLAVKSYSDVARSSHVEIELADAPGTKWYIFAPHWNPVIDKLPQSKPGIDWGDFDSQLSEYFTVGELLNYDIRRMPKTDEVKARLIKLAAELDKIRKEWGSAIRVTSGYRPEPINRQVGGVRNSRHTFGDAIDIAPIKGDIHNFQSFLDRNWFGALGYGARRGFVHLDMRNSNGWRRGATKGPRWNY